MWCPAKTISQEFSLTAIVVMLGAIASGFALGSDTAAIPGGVGIGLWLAGFWCDLRGV